MSHKVPQRAKHQWKSKGADSLGEIITLVIQCVTRCHSRPPLSKNYKIVPQCALCQSL
jgi:hypothetical protein